MARQEEFAELVQAHRQILYKICRSYCPSRDEREDLAQEITIALWRAFGAYDPARSFASWMYRVGFNVAISFYRRDRRRIRPLVSDEALLREPAAPEEGASERSLRLRESIAELEPLNKALALLYLEDLPYREIASILGLSETNVATKLTRLKGALKKRLSAGAASGAGDVSNG